MIVIATHHKAGTVLMHKIFQEICKEKNWLFFSGEQKDLSHGTDIFHKLHYQVPSMETIKYKRDITI